MGKNLFIMVSYNITTTYSMAPTQLLVSRNLVTPVEHALNYMAVCRKVERSNLLNMMKISIKGLIDCCMRGGTVSDCHPQLLQFLILMELTLKHRMKSTLTCSVDKGMAESCGDKNSVVVYMYHCMLLTLCLPMRSWGEG